MAASAATGTLRGCPFGARTLATLLPGLVLLLRLPMTPPALPPALMFDLHPDSIKSLL
jgi:hypothetical protein